MRKKASYSHASLKSLTSDAAVASHTADNDDRGLSVTGQVHDKNGAMMYRYLRWAASSSFLCMASCRLLASSWTFSCSSSCWAGTEQEALPAAALYMMQVVIESKEIRPMPSYWKPMYQPDVMHSAFGCKLLQLLTESAAVLMLSTSARV